MARRKAAVTTYVEPEEYEKIQLLARERGKSISDYVAEMILKEIRQHDRPQTVDERLIALEEAVQRIKQHLRIE